MQFDKNERDQAKANVQKNQGLVAPLKDGWYDVSLTSCRWYEGRMYSRMSLGFRVSRGFNTGKRLFANITFGLKLPGETEVNNAGQLTKLMALASFLGIEQEFNTPEEWAQAIHAMVGSEASYKLRAQLRAFNTLYVAEGYNLVQIAKI